MNQKYLSPLLIIIIAVALVGGYFVYQQISQPSPTPDASPKSDGCMPTGCSGQICSDEDVITTCEFRAEYACYKNAKCDRQTDGKCGWRETEELRNCIEEAKNSEVIQ